MTRRCDTVNDAYFYVALKLLGSNANEPHYTTLATPTSHTNQPHQPATPTTGHYTTPTTPTTPTSPHHINHTSYATPATPHYTNHTTGHTYRHCRRDGAWKRDRRNMSKSDYTECYFSPMFWLRTFIPMAVNVLSMVTLIPSIILFSVFRDLRRQLRIQLHINLFVSLLLGCATSMGSGLIIERSLKANSFEETIIHNNPVWCRIHTLIQLYSKNSSYMWMFCEASSGGSKWEFRAHRVHGDGSQGAFPLNHEREKYGISRVKSSSKLKLTKRVINLRTLKTIPRTGMGISKKVTKCSQTNRVW
ncbi:hypothetical protein HELRODRAFT_182403 [Helobdella robusta]|uniref:G-protein coupled receptors family 2 profile 2 domain-containing protein n=1 Tax=Helobdella robusta TaxID=6412 RepID=T1FI54_HELRO|nr:hypothetical protein HELRODRAFT_182403 [Helobdella robusta]ESN90937.1 hypothetical protein HELRODRAFT_182403 [Helobdella robusta]